MPLSQPGFKFFLLIFITLHSWFLRCKELYIKLKCKSFSIGSSDDCPSTKIKSLGCYNEESIGLFTHTLTMNTNNSVLNCTGRCREASFTFAAMLNGTGCSCGNLQPLGTHRRPATECNVDCPGEPSEKCGGPANRITSHYVEPYGNEINSYINNKFSPIEFYLQEPTGSM